jgi:flagellar basal-body rod modification protein FlgD
MQIGSVGQAATRSILTGAAGRLGEDDFFNMLAVQMSHQDPLNPVENTEFASQIAQFSSLEAVKKLSDAFARFAQGQAIAQASTLIGKTVTGLDPQSGIAVSGQASAVRVVNSDVLVQIGKQEIPLANVIQVN